MYYQPESKKMLSPRIRHEFRWQTYRKLLQTKSTDIEFEEVRESLSRPERAEDLNWILKEAVNRRQDNIIENLSKSGLRVADMGDVNIVTAVHGLAWAESEFAAIVFQMYDSSEEGGDVLVNYRDEHGFTHFHAACLNGNIAMVEKFINQGIDVNLRCQRQFSNYPLMMAIDSKNDKITELLLQNGANPNILDDDATSALHHAVLSDNQRIIKLLVKHNVNPSTYDGYGRTALHFAVHADQPMSVDTMLKQGVNPNLTDSSGRTSIHRLLRRALQQSCLECSEIFDMIQLFVKHQADINAKDAKQNTPLFAVFDIYDLISYESTAEEIQEIRKRQSELVKLLLMNGADTRQINAYGQTILHVIIDSCLRTPIDDTCENPAYSEFHKNSKFTDFVTEMAEIVLEKGVTIEARDQWGKTALHVAVTHLNYMVVIKLLEYGASVDQLSFNRRDFEYAKEIQLRYDTPLLYLDTLELLLSRGYRYDLADFEILRFLIEPCYKIEHAQRVLHMASCDGVRDFCERLIEQGSERALRKLHSDISNYLTTMRMTKWKFLDGQTENYLYGKLKELGKRYPQAEQPVDTKKFSEIMEEAHLAELNRLNEQGTTLKQVMMTSAKDDVTKMLAQFNFVSFIWSRDFVNEFRHTSSIIRGRIVACLLKQRVKAEVRKFTNMIYSWL